MNEGIEQHLVERPKGLSLLTIFYGANGLFLLAVLVFSHVSPIVDIISLVGALLNLSVACGLFLAKGQARKLGIAISVLGLPLLAFGGLPLGVGLITSFFARVPFLAGMLVAQIMDVSAIILSTAAIYYLTRPEVKSYFVRAGRASISLVLDKYNFSLGEELTGVVRVKARDEFDADEIRVYARCVAFTQKTGTHIVWSSKKIDVEKKTEDRMEIPWSERVTVSKALHFTQGYEKALPFNITLPKIYPQTDGRVYNTEWRVTGVIAVRGRPDIKSETINIGVID